MHTAPCITMSLGCCWCVPGLCFFPPSSALEDYVEAFIRQHSSGPIAENVSKFNIKGLLRRRVYHGLAKTSQIPAQEVFAPGSQMNGKRYGQGALDAFMKTNLKLEEFKDTTKKVEPSSKSEKSGGDKGKEKKKKKSKEKKAAAATGGDTSGGASPWQTGALPRVPLCACVPFVCRRHACAHVHMWFVVLVEDDACMVVEVVWRQMRAVVYSACGSVFCPWCSWCCFRQPRTPRRARRTTTTWKRRRRHGQYQSPPRRPLYYIVHMHLHSHSCMRVHRCNPVGDGRNRVLLHHVYPVNCDNGHSCGCRLLLPPW